MFPNKEPVVVTFAFVKRVDKVSWQTEKERKTSASGSVTVINKQTKVVRNFGIEYTYGKDTHCINNVFGTMY